MLSARSLAAYPQAQGNPGMKGYNSPQLTSRQVSLSSLPTPARSVSGSLATAAHQAFDVNMGPLAQMTPRMGMFGAPPPMLSARGTIGRMSSASGPRSPVLPSRDVRPVASSGGSYQPPLAQSFQPPMTQNGAFGRGGSAAVPVAQVQRQMSRGRSNSASALPGLPRPQASPLVAERMPSGSGFRWIEPELPPFMAQPMSARGPPSARGQSSWAPPVQQPPPSSARGQSSWAPPAQRDVSSHGQQPLPSCQSLLIADMPNCAPPPRSARPPPRAGPSGASSWAPPLRRDDGHQRSGAQLPQCPSLVIDMAQPTRGRQLPQCQSLVVDMGNQAAGLPQCQSLVMEMGNGNPTSQSGPCLPNCQSLVLDMGHQPVAMKTSPSMLMDMSNHSAVVQAQQGNGLAGCQTMVAMPGMHEMAMAQRQFALAQQQKALQNCASIVATYPDFALPQTNKDYGALRFASAYCSRQHPAKINTGIPNADAVLEGIDYLGVADGVSGVHALGLPPDALPWELLRSCGKKLFAAAANDEPKPNLDLGKWMINLIQESYDCTAELGATTLLIAALKGNNLVSACLGDSAMLVLRPVSLKPLRLSTVFKTEPGRYDARRPIQIQRLDGLDVASAHEVIQGGIVSTNPVQPGDVMVMGSDGLFDNISDDDITRVIERCCCEATGATEELQQAASTLVELAISRVRLDGDDSARQPWQLDNNAVPANNADDTTALVAMVQAEALAPMTDIEGQLGIEQDSRRQKGAKKRSKQGVFSTCGMKLDRMVENGGSRGSSQRAQSTGAIRNKKQQEECVIA